MRLWGDNLEDLQVASGTIYNEVANHSILKFCEYVLLAF